MPDDLAVFFLAQDEQSGESVMRRLTTFIGAAQRTLDFALYDMRLSDQLKNLLSAALHERAAAGVSSGGSVPGLLGFSVLPASSRR